MVALLLFKRKKKLISITSLILSTTLFLVVLSSVFIIFVNYSKSYQSILSFSKETMQRVSEIIYEKISGLVTKQEQIVEAGAYFFEATQDFSVQNDVLIAYTLGILKANPALYSYFYLKGDKFIEAANIAAAGQTHFSITPDQPLPPGATYRLFYVDHSVQPPAETLVYKNENFETVATESTTKNIFSPESRPWYQEAMKAQGIYWTNVYVDFFTGKRGVTLGSPVFDSRGNRVGVIAVYLFLDELDVFLKQQKIGKTGKAFVLGTSGNVISGDRNDPIVSEAYAHYTSTHEPTFTFEYKDTLYLAALTQFPLQEKHWTILVTVPFWDFFGELLRVQFAIIAVSVVILIISALIAIYFARRISRPIVAMSQEIDKIKHLDFEGGKEVQSNIREIDLMSSSLIAMQAAIRSFSHFVPKEIVNQLIRTGREIRLHGEKKELSIFFLDIQEFTTIAEKVSIETLVSSLAEYYDGLSKIILECQGTIDKYMGDNIMAFWGAPVEDAQHATKAAIAAIRCQKFIEKFNEKQRSGHLPPFDARLGLHCGEVIVGNVGTTERMNYTVLGDPVNVASRLEGLVKIYHTKTIISEDLYRKIGDQFLVRPLDFMAVRGKTHPLKILELVAMVKGDPTLLATPEQMELCKTFAEAYELFFQKKYPEAKVLFSALHEKFPEDVPTKLYLERLNNLKVNNSWST